MSEVAGSQLHMKVCAILGKMSGIPKSGYNDFHKYAYIQESDVLDTIRPALAEAGISVMVSIDDVNVMEVMEKSKILTTVKGTIFFTDSESNEMLGFNIAGQGMDNQDKGLPKAITMAVKYGLMKTFLLGTPDDAEHNQNDHAPAARAAAPAPAAYAPVEGEVAPARLPWETPEEAAASRVPAPRMPARPAGSKPISEAQGRLLYGRAKGKGLSDAERDEIILRISGQSKIDGVQWDQMDQILEAYDAFAANR